MASFEEILSRPAGEIKAPPAYPAGTYHCIIDGPPERGKSNNGNDFLRIKFKIVDPMGDVDARVAQEMQLRGKTFTHDYYITDNAAWRFTEQLLVDSLGLDPKLPSTELMAALPGQQLLVTLKNEPSQDGKRVFHRVNSTAHV